jgi:hypothetical protein
MHLVSELARGDAACTSHAFPPERPVLITGRILSFYDLLNAYVSSCRLRRQDFVQEKERY